MTEKVGLIKNPLTIIAIFAGIAEVSGTIVLPFVAVQNQELFIWFLISFPSLLVITFFATLNFNNKVLYAPSDYTNEENYLVSNKYNFATQSRVTVKEPLNEAFETLSIRIEEISKQINTPSIPKERQSVILESDEKNNITQFEYYIADDMYKRNIFIKRMSVLGYNFRIYSSPHTESRNSKTESQGIWLGINIPLEIAQVVIREAKIMYPFLSYIFLNDYDNSPSEEANHIFIGGSTSAAEGHLKLKPIDAEGFYNINNANSLESLHSYISKYKQ